MPHRNHSIRHALERDFERRYAGRYPSLGMDFARRRRILEADKQQRRRSRRLVTLMAGICLGLFIMAMDGLTQSFAQQLDVVRMDDVSRGELLFRSTSQGEYVPATQLDMDVDIQVSGMIARVRLKQEFENTGSEWAEGVYVFPLPENAAVDELLMHVGERVIVGEIKERAKARATYEKAKAEGKRTSLVEQQRPNMFTTSLANIGPGEKITVEIAYLQTLAYDTGQFRLRFPMAITPRYIPGTPVADTEQQVSGEGWAKNTGQVPDASQITPPVFHPASGRQNSISLQVGVDAGFPLAEISSTYHDVVTDRTGEGRYNIELANLTTVADRDFELQWTPAVGEAPGAALFTQEHNGEQHAFVMLMPPHQYTQASDQAREMILVIDTSGSMAGVSIKQARSALKLALTTLQSQDRFNIIQFNSVTSSLFTTSVAATPENLAYAQRYVNGLHSTGGTEMASALTAALKGEAPDGLLRQVVFITDGSVGNETALFKLIADQLSDARLFTVGIGSAPNSYFMRKAAEHGRGTFTYIGDVNEVQQKMGELFSKLESPVLTDLKIKWPQGTDAWPNTVPDLYTGEPVVLSARLPKAGGEVYLQGASAGVDWTQHLDLNGGRQHEGIAKTWARAKIEALMDQSLSNEADKEELREQIVDLGLAYHLVSKHTSLVAVDKTPARPVDASLKKEALPQTLPHGQEHDAVLAGYPSTATAAQLKLLLGMFGLLLAIFSHYGFRRAKA